MKIISNYKDYYDGIVNTVGIDSNIIFERHENDEELIMPYKFYSSSYEDRSNSSIWDRTIYSFRYIGFCGKVYPMLQINKNYYQSINNTIEYIYDIETIKKYFFQCYDQKDKYILNHHNWNTYIDQVNNKFLLSLFLDKKIVSFLIYKQGNTDWSTGSKVIAKIHYNNILKNVEFYKCIDAFTAFNEISIFVAEQLNTEISTFNLSDKQMVVSKGFDPVYGFRKRKNA